MAKKEKFIEMVEKLIKDMDTDESCKYQEAIDYFNVFKAASADDQKAKFTENGKKILMFMQDNKDKYNNLFKAKEVGEGMGIPSRQASGSMRKLVTDGYIEKIGTNPVVYSLTAEGINVNCEEA